MVCNQMKASLFRLIHFAATIALACAFSGVALQAADAPPSWAYGTQPQAAPVVKAPKPPPDATPQHLPGSTLEFTKAQIGNPFGPADWYPGDHPEMPPIVAHGRQPAVWACSLCHYPNGKGRPENAGVSGLPVSYFVNQMHDFRDGLRKSSDPRKKNTNLMVTYAKTMTDEEIQAAAVYFGGMPWTPWIRVVETATVPQTRLSVGMFLPLEGTAREPIGDRIIEVPDNPDATEVLRNPRSGFIAYVPAGSVTKGAALVTNGAGKTVACAVCHGVGLNGLGPVPGIAGRSPSYIARQLFDMQQNTRKGQWTELMKPVVSKLSNEDILDIVAYTSSQTPAASH